MGKLVQRNPSTSISAEDKEARDSETGIVVSEIEVISNSGNIMPKLVLRSIKAATFLSDLNKTVRAAIL